MTQVDEINYNICCLSLQSHWQACWCSGHFKIQGISRYGIDPQNWNILSPASEELILSCGRLCCYKMDEVNAVYLIV